MSLYGETCKIGGLSCGLVLRGGSNGSYQAVFEREFASLEEIEALEWDPPAIEGTCILPEGYGFEVRDIQYSAAKRAYTVVLQVGRQYLGDVTGYQAQIQELQETIQEQAAAIAEKDGTISEQAATIQSQQSAIAEKEETIAGQAATIQSQLSAIAEKDDTIAQQALTIQKQQTVVTGETVSVEQAAGTAVSVVPGIAGQTVAEAESNG